MDPLAPIDVSPHAAQRLWERFRESDLSAVRGQIRSAILDGHVLDAPPPWAVTRRALREHRPGTSRYAFPPACDRVYVLQDDCRTIIVKTVLEAKQLGYGHGQPFARPGYVRVP